MATPALVALAVELEQLEGVRAALAALPAQPAAALLQLAPGLLVRCAPDATRALLPAPLGGGGWAPLPAAQAALHARAQALQAREGAEVEAWAAAQAAEGSVRARCAERATAKAALERYLGVANVEVRGENVVEVREEGGESVMYITEFEGEGAAPAAARGAAAPAEQPPPDPARERAIMKRLSYLEALEAGREAEWTDPEGREPLPPLPQRHPAPAPAPAPAAAAPAAPTGAPKAPAASSAPLAAARGAAPAAALPQQLLQQQEKPQPLKQQQPQQQQPTPAAPAPAPTMSLFKQRALAARRGGGASE
jgi:hypothetical protein